MTETSLRKKTVALVDDSPLVLEMAKAALEEAGFSVLGASTIVELELLLVRAKPDLFVIDVDMPEISGDDVATVLRMVRGIDAPIWLFSDLPETELSARAREAKVQGFVSKRAGVAKLVDAVRATLEGLP
jgi:DNA-binding NarL/FixJ family response regulator